jgi:hypothetical protein
MMKTTYSKKTFKRYLAPLCILLISTVIIVAYFQTPPISSAQTTNLAVSETQFKIEIPYAYAGHFTTNGSYTDSNGNLMCLESQYPTAVVLNITRLPGTQIAACDAEIEVYGVQIVANTGETENHGYFVGTNYNSSFSGYELSALEVPITSLADPNVYNEIRGNFCFNWTDSTSILSHSIGSVGCYANGPTSAGLWSSGKPNAVSVTIHRIGYITMKDGLVSVYKDASISNIAASAQLSSYGDGLICNTLVNLANSPMTDLFHPTAANKIYP